MTSRSFSAPGPGPGPADSPVPGHVPQSFRLRSEADVLALVPFMFGFHPQQSLVVIMIDTGPSRPFSARVDLPADPGDLDAVVGELVVAAERNGRADSRALVVAYTDEHELAELAVCVLTVELEKLGMDVVLAIRAHDSAWYRLGDEAGGSPDAGPEAGPDAGPFRGGQPYDLTSHQLMARSVLEGRVVFSDRAELAASLSLAAAEQGERVAAAHEALTELRRLSKSALVAEERWLTENVASWLAGAPPQSPTALARLLRGLESKPLRDAVWCTMTRDNASAHVRLWTAVVRQVPDDLVAPAAGLLAFAAWLSGDGALAWCSVERSLASDPDHTLARLVGRALERAVPPTVWSLPGQPDRYAG